MLYNEKKIYIMVTTTLAHTYFDMTAEMNYENKILNTYLNCLFTF